MGGASDSENPSTRSTTTWRSLVERERHPEKSVRGSFLRSFLPVAATYVLSAVGLKFTASPVVDQIDQNVPPWLAMILVLLFTLTHAVVPVFFYLPFVVGLSKAQALVSETSSRLTLRFVRGFIHLHMGIWFGIPLLALGAATGWLSLIGGALHVLMAKRGTRHWVYLEYGSTSLALLLLIVMFSREAFFPFGLVVMVCQAAMLTILDWKARDLWVSGSEKLTP